jgi:hypothetical protein
VGLERVRVRLELVLYERSLVKPALVNPAEGLRRPSILVKAPRAVIDFYWHSPWPIVLESAQAGRDGLEVWDIKDHNNFQPQLWFGPQDLKPADPPDVAWLAEGQQDLVGKTVLYQQNFTNL